MKVGYVAPMSIAAVNGGLRTQALHTIKHIKEFGVEPVLLSPWNDIREQELDLVHVFGASIENVGIIEQVKLLGLHLALSPVFFSNRSSFFIKKAIQFEKLVGVFGNGIRSEFSIKAKLCSNADLNLPNTTSEARLIENGFTISNHQIEVVPNGVESRFAEATAELFYQKYGLRNFVLFSGQAGAPRKNVIKLLDIAPKIDAPIVIIGSIYDDKYGIKCRTLAGKAENVTLIETLEHDSELLASAYAASKVFVLPSQFETPGIAAMEAALTGSNIVITDRGGTADYFGDYVNYINPNSSASLLQGVENALKTEPSNALKNHILENFTWQKVAELTAEQYKKLLK